MKCTSHIVTNYVLITPTSQTHTGGVSVAGDNRHVSYTWSIPYLPKTSCRDDGNGISDDKIISIR